ncbi:histone-lysine N-methyltransferase SUV39H2-like isoform X2 [Amphibalanus amphitrite]|uniref:histone-lysine N-methyltransferase SUV39H2-like isoform X2 n=1 Tax=Amphibalanus amphitrite TaxID=1232801 RepID=UPI001C9129FA|nr:histone-lysine N-methyltransferase SUV39H2-like isoform X2 [Amphibalanus amphitrite]
METTETDSLKAVGDTTGQGPVNGMDTQNKQEVSGKRKRDEDEPQPSAVDSIVEETHVESKNEPDHPASPDFTTPNDSFQSAVDGDPAPAEGAGGDTGGPSRRSSRAGTATPAGAATGAAKKADDGNDSDSTTGLEEDEFLVEKILDYTRENGVDMFLIKWKGWNNTHNTWEPQENLSCLEMMIDFFKERELAHQNKRRKTEPSMAREGYVQMFEEEYLQMTPNEVAKEFSQHLVNGQLKFKEKLKPIKTVHMEIESFVRRNGLKPDSLKALRKVRHLRDQLLQHKLVETRERQLVRLKQWEDDINTVCSDSAKIVVENAVDLALPPDNFVYKNDYVPGEGVVIPSDPVIGCDCTVCYPGTSCCSEKAGAPPAYTKAGKLRLQVGQPIYECNKACRCESDCFNRVVQRGRKVKLSIFRTSNGCGWGVKALESIKRGSFVAEYVGEVITNEEAERRGEKYDSVGVTYLFDLDFNDHINLYTVDAAMYGNISHFINHSCEPNLVVYGMWSDCLDPNLPRLALFACRDILKGEQLYFDYNSPLGSNVSGKPLTPTAGAAKPPPTVSVALSPPPADGSRTPPRQEGTPDAPSEALVSPTKSPRRQIGGHPSARITCKCGAKACRRYLF